MSSRISRRNFLKLLPLASVPIITARWPRPLKPLPGLLQDSATPNILILVFDTLSAKHVSLHGYNRETTPNLARFADKAVVYHAHYATGNFTSPGTASLFTGVYPWSHRAFHLYGEVDGDYLEKNLFHLAPPNYHRFAYTHNLLVAALLQQFRADLDLWKQTGELCLDQGIFSDQLFVGDRNVALRAEFSHLSSDPLPGSLYSAWLRDAYRLLKANQRETDYGRLFPRGVPSQRDSQYFILEHTVDWLMDQVSQGPRPFLGYIHVLPPHSPYSARHDFVDVFKDGWQPSVKERLFFAEGLTDEALNHERRLYDEFIAYADAELGRLVDFMERQGLLENTYVIVTSDHGELFERGILGHETETLYEPLLHVPLVISRPGQSAREDVHDRTSCVDLLPTLLDIMGQPIPGWCDGRVLPGFGSRMPNSDRPIFALEAKSNYKAAPLTTATVAMVKGRYKLIHYLGYEEVAEGNEMYDLLNDPDELEDIYSPSSVTARELQSELEETLFSADRAYLGQRALGP